MVQASALNVKGSRFRVQGTSATLELGTLTAWVAWRHGSSTRLLRTSTPARGVTQPLPLYHSTIVCFDRCRVL